jgi:hypothetical protein
VVEGSYVGRGRGRCGVKRAQLEDKGVGGLKGDLKGRRGVLSLKRGP